MLLAAAASEPYTLRGALVSRDTRLMRDALERLGAVLEVRDGVLHVSPIPPACEHPAEPIEIHTGLAGTVMRFLPPAAALATGRVVFDGDPHARERPQTTILDALRGLGVAVDGDRLPFSIDATGTVPGGEVTIDASGSSQFVSGLLLSAAPAAPRTVEEVLGDLEADESTADDHGRLCSVDRGDHGVGVLDVS